MSSRLQHEQRLAAGSWWNNEENLVFTSPYGKPCDSTAVRKEFREIIAASAVEGDWTPNLLRHSAASLMADAGMPIELVADQLGHRDLRMLSATIDTASARPFPAEQSSMVC